MMPCALEGAVSVGLVEGAGASGGEGESDDKPGEGEEAMAEGEVEEDEGEAVAHGGAEFGAAEGGSLPLFVGFKSSASTRVV